jgi:hypothetical protein
MVRVSAVSHPGSVNEDSYLRLETPCLFVVSRPAVESIENVVRRYKLLALLIERVSARGIAQALVDEAAAREMDDKVNALVVRYQGEA